MPPSCSSLSEYTCISVGLAVVCCHVPAVYTKTWPRHNHVGVGRCSVLVALRLLLQHGLLNDCLLQAGKASVPEPAAAQDAAQPAKPPKKPRATRAKPTLVSKPAGDSSKLAKPPRKARSTKTKPSNALVAKPADEASKLAKPARKSRTTKAKTVSALVTDSADDTVKLHRKPRSTRPKLSSVLELVNDVSQLAKPTRKRRSTTTKPAGRRASSKAAAASASSSESSGLSDSDASSQGSMGSSAKQSTPARATKQSRSRTEEVAVLASQAADAPDSVTSHRDQPGNEADGELAPTKKSWRSKREATVSRSSAKQGKDVQARVVLPSYKQLKDQGAGQGQLLHVPFEERRAIKAHMRAFKGSAHVQDQALALYVNSQVS